MKGKDCILLGIAVVLGGVYILNFTHWLVPKPLEVEHSARLARDAWGQKGRVPPNDKAADNPINVTFTFHEPCPVRSLEVVPTEAYKTNRYTPRLWAQEAIRGSVALSGFSYGQPISGMRPEFASAEVQPLEPGMHYTLIIKASRQVVKHDFSVPLQTAFRR